MYTGDSNASKKKVTTNTRRPTNHKQEPKPPSNNTQKIQPKREEDIENFQLERCYNYTVKIDSQPFL